jgi:hypothetical protein
MDLDDLWTAKDLEAMPTLSASQFDDLKIDTGALRVWLCRCGLEDGAEFEKGITIEILSKGRWNTIKTYEGANGHDSR